MLVLFSFILMGYAVAKVKVIPENSAVVLSKLENNLFVPALVLGTFVSNFTVKKLGVAAGMAIVSHLLSALTIPAIFYLMTNFMV